MNTFGNIIAAKEKGRQGTGWKKDSRAVRGQILE